MPKTNNPRIPQARWDSHKETIRKLYLLEDKGLMGEGGVIELMKRKGLSASKPQYETQFMRWGFKKKLTRETWHTIGHIIKDQDEAGFLSHVYANGTRLPDEKVKKEIARYRNCNTDENCCTRKGLPTGVEVRSDQEDVERTIFSLEAQGIHLNSPQTINPSSNRDMSDASWNLPKDFGPCHLNSPNDFNNRTQIGLLGSPIYHDVSNRAPFPDILGLIPSPLPTPSGQFVEDARFLLSTSPIVEGLYHNPFALHEYSRPSPWSTLTSQFCDTQISFEDIRGFGGSRFIPVNTISLFNLSSPLFREFRALLRNGQPEILASISPAKYLLPSEPSGELQRHSVDMVILKQILYLLMNNFAGSDYAVFDTLFEQVKQFPVSHMEDMLDALPHPFAAALQQSILTIAIKSSIPALVSILLRRGIDANRVACRFDGYEYTPLGLACKFHLLEVVKILLSAGADPNKPSQASSIWTPMYLLIEDKGLYSGEEVIFSTTVADILRYLLDAGARINYTVLNSRRFWANETILGVYVQHNKLSADFSLQDGIPVEFPRDIRLSKAEIIGAVFQSAFQGLALQNTSKYIQLYLQTVLEVASYWGDLSLVDYLLEFGVKPNVESLCEAIYANNLVLAKKYINLGVGFHDILPHEFITMSPVRTFPSTIDSCLLGGYSFGVVWTTPFAEAVRHGRQEIISLFESCKLSVADTQVRLLGPAILAAAEVGNKDMVRKLLPMYNETIQSQSRHWIFLVAAATFGGHDDIVELLMMAGVRPNDISIAAAILTRNARLAELFLNSTTATYSEAGCCTFAVRWGDHDVLRLLINAGVSLNRVETGFGESPLELPSWKEKPNTSPLAEAIRRGNHGVVQLLLENGADVNGHSPMKYDSPLEQAVERGDEALVQSLLDHGADPNDPRALLAATKKSCKLTSVILAAFCQWYPRGNKTFTLLALREAIKKENETLISMLIIHADVNFIDYHEEYTGGHISLFGEGIATCNIKIVQTLLHAGGDPNRTVQISDEGGLNAVLKAILTGNLDMVKLLHTAGANLDFSATLRITHTALQLAVELGHFEIVEYLLNQGVDVNAPPCIWEGATALQYAAKTGSVRIAEMLLERGVDINAPGSKYQGRTAFEFAAEHGRIDMLLWLFGAGVDIVSDGGKQIRRARELAEKSGQIAAKDLVEQLGEESHQRATFGSNFLPATTDGFIQNMSL